LALAAKQGKEAVEKELSKIGKELEENAKKAKKIRCMGSADRFCK
jgi:hypothetical protein